MNRLAACALEVDKPARMIVRGPDDRPALDADGGMTWIDVWSSDSEAARRHERAAADRRLAGQTRGAPTAAEMDEAATDYLVAVTAGWGVRKPVGEGFEDVPATDYSPAAARAFYAAPAFAYIARQVSEFAGKKQNFAKASPRS